MIIDCISDLHGNYPELEGGDLLIVCGDLTARDDCFGYAEFSRWFDLQQYQKKIFISGNHDNQLQNVTFPLWIDGYSEYLCDSGTEVLYHRILDPPNLDKIGIPYKRKTLKVWGSPWTRAFEGMNPHCKAFTCETEEELAEKWALIPDDIDILVTHSPPYGMHDYVMNGNKPFENVGSKTLGDRVIRLPNIKLFVCGHIHEGYGESVFLTEKPNGWNECVIVNASHVNEHYKPVNKPIRVIL